MTGPATPPAPGPGPAVERFPAAALRGGEPFAVLYGPGVDDVFVDGTHQVCTLEETLWRLLRAEGYERIVFSSLSDPVYFRDDASRDRSRRAAAPRRAAPRTMRHQQLRGPLGGMLVSGLGAGGDAGERGADPAGAAGATGPAPSATGVSDPFGVMTLAGYLRRRDQRTAVVFPYAEEVLRHHNAARQLAHAMADWSQQSDGRNLWVLVFRRPTLEGVAGFVAGQGGFPLLETYVRQQMDTPGRPGTARIGFPQAAEVERLIHATRLRDGLRIGDWRELAPIVRAMAGQPWKARTWRTELVRLARQGGALDADAVRGWVEGADTDPRPAWERLAAMPGLDAVKRHFERLRAEVEATAALRDAGHTAVAEPPALHLVFAGNPGTGKTTVARLVGEVYRDLGLLGRGHVVEAKVRDLVAGYVGQTATLIDETVERALDGVLFIDEAYALSDQSAGFGGEAIQTLISRMENDRGRLAVVAAGYPDKMEEFLDANPGLRSRFPTVLDFTDYPPDTLLAILLGRLTRRGPRLSPEAEEELARIVAGMYRTRDAAFGNAREMRTLADEVYALWAARVRRHVDRPVVPEDIPETYRTHLAPPAPDPAGLLAELDRYVGLGPVREHLTQLANRLRLRQSRGGEGFAAPHLLFTGPPGTGKTTVARLVGRMFRDLGLLRKGHVLEVTRAELVGVHIGETAPKVQKAVQDALDGVLFIDEAYSLARDTSYGGYGAEAIDTLTREMEHWRGRLVVIAAGYPREMAEFLDSNSGLKSRFTEPIPFPPYSTADLVEVLRRSAAAEGYVLGAGVADRAARWLERRRAADPAGFGNARTVRGLLEVMEGRMAARFALHGWPQGPGPDSGPDSGPGSGPGTGPGSGHGSGPSHATGSGPGPGPVVPLEFEPADVPDPAAGGPLTG